VIIAYFDLTNLLLTMDFTHWYGSSTLVGLLACAALAIYGFHTSLAGQSMFRGGLLEEG
jgi:hypothetical protein